MSLPEFLSHVVVPEVAVAKETDYYLFFYEVTAKAKHEKNTKD